MRDGILCVTLIGQQDMSATINIQNINVSIHDYALRPDRIILSAAGKHSSSCYALVTMTDSDGVTGYGEAATTPLWSGEAAHTARWAIDHLFSPIILDDSWQHPAEALAALDRAVVGHPFAKSAIDTAMWDLWAKKQNVSVLNLIADRPPVMTIPTRSSIGAYPVARTVAIARTFTELGIRTLKFKVGVDGVDDIERLRAVRGEVGDDVIFTVDANGGYATVDDAVRAAEAMAPFNLALFEQPTPRDRLAMLAEVRRRIDMPVMADESIFTPDDLAEAIDLDAFDVLSVYPGKNGGFTHALNMARTAQQAGKACAIGSNLETDIGHAASAVLGAACSAFDVDQYAGDLISPVFYEQSAADPPLELRDGRVAVPSGIGFGVAPV